MLLLSSWLSIQYACAEKNAPDHLMLKGLTGIWFLLSFYTIQLLAAGKCYGLDIHLQPQCYRLFRCEIGYN